MLTLTRTFVILISFLGLIFCIPQKVSAATVTIQPDGTTGQDTWIEYFSATNHGSESTMQIYASGGAGMNFGFIKFPLTDIPNGATVSSATMTILITSNDFATNLWHLYPVTSSWEENTMTWNNQPAVDNGSPMLVDPGSLTGLRDVNVTSWVQDWVNGTRTNYGMRIGFQSNTPNDTIYIATSEFGQAMYWPKLTVTYTGGSTPTPTPSPTPSGGGGGTTGTPKPTPKVSTTPSPVGTPDTITASDDPAADPTPTPETTDSDPAPFFETARIQSESLANSLISDWRDNGPPLVKSLLGTAAIVALADTVLQSGIFLWHIARQIPSLLYSLWINVLVFLGFRKRSTPWGRAINSVTNEPIALATITLHDQNSYGRVAARALTDKNGRFGFFANPGNYSLWLKQPGYTFPSRLLQNVYRGAMFPIGTEGMIVLDLFADPLSTSSGWRTGMTQISYWVATIRIPLLIIGTLISLYFFVAFTSFLNGIVLFVYVFAWFRELYQRQFNRHTLEIHDQKGQPLPYAPIRVIDRVTKQVVATRTTDTHGEVYMLVPRGDYTFAITNPATQVVTEIDIPLPEGIFIKHRTIKIK